MIALVDYDSMLYGAVWKICSFSDIRKWLNAGRSREWIEKEIVQLSINRLSQMAINVLAEIEDTGIEIESTEYFLTMCKNSFRKQISSTYKGKRKRNKWVNKVRAAAKEMDFAKVDDIFEADDLIKDRAVEIGKDGCVICSIDKDLKQIPGYHFDYYRPKLKDKFGNPQLDENGFRKIAPCRGISVVSDFEGNRFFWQQVLQGDPGDNIDGLPGIGKVKARKILDGVDSEFYEDRAKAEYMEVFNGSLKEYELTKLLVGLGKKDRLEAINSYISKYCK